VVRPHSTGPKVSTFQGEHIAPHNKPGITRDGRDRCIAWQACGSVAAQHTPGILPAMPALPTRFPTTPRLITLTSRLTHPGCSGSAAEVMGFSGAAPEIVNGRLVSPGSPGPTMQPHHTAGYSSTHSVQFIVADQSAATFACRPSWASWLPSALSWPPRSRWRRS
jgi:hypothetical protein